MPAWVTHLLGLVTDALIGATAIAIVALAWDQGYRRIRFCRISGTYREADRPERSIKVSYRSGSAFRAACEEDGRSLWVGFFAYDPKTRIAAGNYRYTNGANPDDWGEHRLHFEQGEVYGIDRNMGGGVDVIHKLHWVRQ